MAKVSAAILAALVAGVQASQIPLAMSVEHKTRVPIILGVMSRCPDALLCESVLDSVFQQSWDKIDVNLSFIAQITPREPVFGVTCLHGPEECRGNIHELCATKIAATQQDWWQFVQCLNFEGREHVGEEDLAMKCADVANIHWEDTVKNNKVLRHGLKSCIEDKKQGLQLLKASAKRTADLGITKSCSIMITGKIRCIHDSEWQQCETGHTEAEFLDFINKEYERLNQEK